jgi:phosphatidylglycerophosphatase A
VSLPPGNRERDTAQAGRPPFWATFIATGAFTGLSPWASGTVGTLAGLLVVLIPGATDPLPLALLIVAGMAVGGPAAHAVARHVGHRLTASAARTKSMFQPGDHGTPDPSMVVIDEIVGIWITLLFLPQTIPAYVCAFVTFRGLDILKPPPARQLEAVPNGWGIMLDDVVAGMYANLATQIIIRVLIPAMLAW